MSRLRKVIAVLLAIVLMVGLGETVRAEIAMMDASGTMTMAEDAGASDCGICSGGDSIPAECTAVGCSGCGSALALVPGQGNQGVSPLPFRACLPARLSPGLSLPPHPAPPKHSVLS